MKKQILVKLSNSRFILFSILFIFAGCCVCNQKSWLYTPYSYKSFSETNLKPYLILDSKICKARCRLTDSTFIEISEEEFLEYTGKRIEHKQRLILVRSVAFFSNPDTNNYTILKTDDNQLLISYGVLSHSRKTDTYNWPIILNLKELPTKAWNNYTVAE